MLTHVTVSVLDLVPVCGKTNLNKKKKEMETFKMKRKTKSILYNIDIKI